MKKAKTNRTPEDSYNGNTMGGSYTREESSRFLPSERKD
jgi:hypothetical protein